MNSLFASPNSDPTARLDAALAAFSTGSIRCGFDQLIEDLDRIQQGLPIAAWRHFVQRMFRDHPIHEVLRQDPFTRHAFDKPRGYAGDAELIDYIYGYGDGIVLPACTARGRELYGAAMHTVPCQAVRNRKYALAKILDEVAARGPGARVTSIAAGHLREAATSRACQERQLAEFIALDQDERSLAVIDRDYGHLGVKAVPGSVRGLLAGRLPLQDFDLVYSTGLFDYLNERTAKALIKRMFEMLRPGGEIVVANFVRGVSGTGYMESCMDWHLLYRDGREMLALLDDVDEELVADRVLERDPSGGIVFLRARRAD